MRRSQFCARSRTLSSTSSLMSQTSIRKADASLSLIITITSTTHFYILPRMTRDFWYPVFTALQAYLTFLRALVVLYACFSHTP